MESENRIQGIRGTPSDAGVLRPLRVHTIRLRRCLGWAVLLGLLLGWFQLPVGVQAATLHVRAANDRPGPVQAQVQGWDASCVEQFDSTLEWPDDDNSYSVLPTSNPAVTVTHRFTFINDQAMPPFDEDNDRNFHLDWFALDAGSPTQGEHWTRSWGHFLPWPPNTVPSCVVSNTFGADVATCHFAGDWVEYGPPCPESSCTDDLDNNDDGLTDCQDTGCCKDVACNGVGICELGTEATCDDGQDNDGDGDVDCLDSDCNNVDGCEFGAELTCNDVIDNDGDSDVDCADSDCTASFCESTEETCNDSFDNDGDGDVDCLDSDCNNVDSCEFGAELTCDDIIDNDGDSDVDCLDADCQGFPGCGEIVCNDVIDNDADGLADCLDSDCDNVDGCEFGAELTCDDLLDNDGDSDVDCADSDCTASFCESIETTCDDNIDNDGDGDVDCVDSDCVGNPMCPPPDWDGDGVIDTADNCSNVSNTAQIDTDDDKCGNKCDADYDQSGTPDGGDFGAFAFAFGTSDEEKCHTGPIPGCTVDGADFGFFAFAFGVTPGPSGTTTFTTACPNW